MTTKSSILSIKSRFSSNSSVHGMAGSDGDSKQSRIHVKKPFSTANYLQNNSTNGFSNRLKQRTLQLNNFFHSKLKINQHSDHVSNNQSDKRSTSPPLVFHGVSFGSPDEINKTSNPFNHERKSADESKPAVSPRNSHILANTIIRTLSTDLYSTQKQLSLSDDEETSSKLRPVLSSIDGDAEESDNGRYKDIRKLRLQKSDHPSLSSSQQKTENNHSIDTLQSQEQQQTEHSSSDEDEKNNSGIIMNGHDKRRSNLVLTKEIDHRNPIKSTTITDDDTKVHDRFYHLIDNIGSKNTMTNEFNSSESTPNNKSSVKKVKRFQINSIHKSELSHITLTDVNQTKPSNELDYTIADGNPNPSMKSSPIDAQSTNITIAAVESPIISKHNIVNGEISTFVSVEHGAHICFHELPPERHDSVVDDEKSSSLSVTTAVVPSPTPVMSTITVQGDDDEEAIGKSPDNRFIKYATEIGRGAFKTVYRGLDTETNVAVAWCELQDFAHFDRHERIRFKEEAEMLKKLQHPNIVRFYDFWEETNPRTNKKVIILVTELMTSGSLKGYIRKFKGQKEDKRINVMKKWCRQILKGLAYLHSRNPPVIHRDLKCDNVFISSTTGCVKIGDLGLATFKTQTFAKSMRGTMEFMAPEMFEEQYDELVDIYSFGLCMLEMITGEYPYIECKRPTAVIKRVTAGLKPDCYYKVENEDVREVIDCCLRTNKEERLPVHELLQHSFFLHGNGLRVEFVRDPANDSQVMVTNNSINLKLKVIDKTKRKALWTEHEALLFRYNCTTDTPEQIADELMEKNYILDDDKKFVIQSINDRLRAYHYELIDRKAGVFSRDGKPTLNSTSQSLTSGQHHQQIPLHQQQQPPLRLSQQQSVPTVQQSTPSIVAQPQVPIVPTNASTSAATLQPLIDVQQQQQQPPQMLRLSSETIATKPVVATEPIAIPQLSELGASISGSSASLEILDAALKKTFNKTNTSQGTSMASTLSNDVNEPLISLVNQDDPSTMRLINDAIAVVDQQSIEESGGLPSADMSTNAYQLPMTLASQNKSQSMTILNTPHQQIIQNPFLLTQTSQNFSYSSAPPTTQNLMTSTIPNETIKQSMPSSTTIATSETIENGHLSQSPPYTTETLQSSMTSDTPSTTPPPMLDSLKQLDALLKNTFKTSSKTTAATTLNSDTETTNTNAALVTPLTISDEQSTRMIDIESDEKQRYSNSMMPPQSHFESQGPPIIFSKPIQQTMAQSTNQIPAYFDPLMSSEGNVNELDSLPEASRHGSLSNDNRINTTSSNDVSEIKSMLMDLSKTLINKMNILELKVDEHRNQTTSLNNLLTNTVLPSFLDLAAIVHETPHLDPRVRTKLEEIQLNIRIVQQQKQTDMKDLMDI